MEEKTATIIGSTGLIGSHILDLLRRDERFGNIRLIVRRSVEKSDTKTEVRVIDFSDDAAFREAIAGSDSVFCAVGTTQKKVKGDMAEYRKVDFDIPVKAAKFCEETGCKHFLLVSSVGADSTSKNFYLKLKGEVEDELHKLSIPSVSVFRPSMLMGERTEKRPAEAIAKALSKPLAFLFPPKYRPIYGRKVAEAMIKAAKSEKQGYTIYHYNDMKRITA